MKVKNLRLTFVIVILLAGVLSLAARTQAGSQIEAGLRDAIAANGSGRYLVYMEEQADLSAAYSMDWESRGHYVYNTLRDTAQNSQSDISNFLENQALRGAVSDYQSFFIVNAIMVDSDLETFDAIAKRSDVAAIYAPKDYEIPEPVVLPDVDSPAAIEWGVDKIRADEVWSTFGATGQGIVVANIDTGVEYTHSALNAQYRGTVTGNHDFNFYDPSNICGGTVCDNNNHGTHTMGTMVGDDGGANQIGVAPGATWIAAKGCESSSCSSTALLDSAEWILAPCAFGEDPGHPSCDPDMRPNIVNNSWGGGGGDPWYQASVNAWEASGILPAFSAGNSGPGASTIGSPGDYCNVVASGATDISDNIASFSSRGPGDFAACTDKPDVTAPGVSVRSSITGNSYALFNGTSMASPHTAGCMALLLSIDPSLTYTDIYTLLTTTAVDLGAGGFDFNFGYGRIDCFEAALAIGGGEGPEIDVNPTSMNETLPPGGQSVQGLDISNVGGAPLNWVIEEDVDAPVQYEYVAGRYAASTGAAPVDGIGVAPSNAPTLNSLGSLVRSWNSQNGPYFTIFDLDTPQTVPNIALFPAGGNFIGAGEFVNGLSYMVDTANNVYEVDDAGNILNQYLATDPPGSETYSGMALDPTTGNVYAASTDVFNSRICEFDVLTGAATSCNLIAGSPGHIGLSFDGVGNAFGYDIVNDTWMQIDPDTGATSNVVALPFDANFGQGLMYDPATGLINILAFNNGTFQAELWTVNVSNPASPSFSFVAVLGSTVPGGLNQLSWGGTDLNVTPPPCVLPSDIPWASVSPDNGTTAAGDTTTVNVTFDATGLTPGTYTGNLCVTSNDPDPGPGNGTELVIVPLELTVSDSATAISFKIQSRYNPPAAPGIYQAKVRVIDPDIPAVIPGATVDVTLTLPDGTVMKSAVTTPSGWAFFQHPTAGGGNCTITVDDITAPGYTFDPNQGVTTQTIPCSMLVSQTEWTETP